MNYWLNRAAGLQRVWDDVLRTLVFGEPVGILDLNEPENPRRLRAVCIVPYAGSACRAVHAASGSSGFVRGWPFQLHS